MVTASRVPAACCRQVSLKGCSFLASASSCRGLWASGQAWALPPAWCKSGFLDPLSPCPCCSSQPPFPGMPSVPSPEHVKVIGSIQVGGGRILTRTWSSLLRVCSCWACLYSAAQTVQLPGPVLEFLVTEEVFTVTFRTNSHGCRQGSGDTVGWQSGQECRKGEDSQETCL